MANYASMHALEVWYDTIDIDRFMEALSRSRGSALLRWMDHYRTKWAAGGITYEIEINTTASPATMAVAEPKLGCKWSGKAS